MRTYLAIMVGQRPDTARPILATSDRSVVLAAIGALLARVGVGDTSALDAEGTAEGDDGEVPDAR